MRAGLALFLAIILAVHLGHESPARVCWADGHEGGELQEQDAARSGPERGVSAAGGSEGWGGPHTGPRGS